MVKPGGATIAVRRQCAQTIPCDTQGANDETRFARVDRTTKTFHEQVNPILVNKTHGTIRASANGMDDVEDVIALL